MLTDEEKALVARARVSDWLGDDDIEGLLILIDRITTEPAILDAAEGILRKNHVENIAPFVSAGAMIEARLTRDRLTTVWSQKSLSEAVAKLKGGG